MTTIDAKKELVKKGTELYDLGIELERYREKLNTLAAEELSLSSFPMGELSKQFDRLHNAYMKAEEEYKYIKLLLNTQQAEN